MTIEDIIIPKKEIVLGTDWENEVRPILKSYADLLGDDMATPTTERELRACENNLKTTLPTELRLFYSRFGAAKLQEGLLDVNDFCYITKNWGTQFLDNYTKAEQEVLSKLVVFGDSLGDGNCWCFHTDSKEIFYFVHDTKPNINGMFKTFGQYIQSMIIFSQREMAEGELDKEIEDIVVGLIGQERVKVWQYFGGWG